MRAVTVGFNSVAIVYDSAALRRTVIERIAFNDERRGIRAEALHVTPRPMT